MQKSPFFFLILFFSVLIAQAQSPDSLDKKSRFIKSFRVNVNYNYFHDYYINTVFPYSLPYYGYNGTPIQTFGNVGIGYTLKSRKNFNSHYIEVSNIGIDYRRYSSNYRTNRSVVSLRYQYNYFFIKRGNTSFSPYLGVSYLFNISKSRLYQKYYGGQSHYTFLQLSNQFALVPGIQYRLNDRVYFDLSVPIDIFRGSLYQRKSKESSAYNYTARNSDWLSFFNSRYVNIRLGVGIIMNPEKRKEEADQKYIKTFKINFYPNSSFYNKQVNLSLSGLSPSITFQNVINRNMHEIEFTKASGQFNENQKNYSVSARYQYDYFFIKKPSLFAPYIGASALFNYNHNNNKTMFLLNPTYTNYGSRSAYFEYTLAAVPGIQIYPCSKFYLDLSLPVNIWGGGVGYYRTDNPLYVQDNYSGWYGDWEKRYHAWNFRAGIGFKL
jgi:hypothetical protein